MSEKFTSETDVTEKTCTWKYDDYSDFYETICGETFCLEGTPEENHISFCPYCGCPIAGDEATEENETGLDQYDKPDLDPLTLYRQLLALYRKRVWFADDYDYLIFALYTMLSHVYPVFDAIPYLHLSGLAGSGKTHAARLLATLAFNGHIEVDPTEASLFRTIEATRGLVVLDDQETGVTNRSHSDNPFMTILKVGYKRGGKVTRMERRGANFVPLCFDVYCPKVITNVFGLEDILSDRTIPILMREIPSNLVNKFDTSPLTARQSQPIVDKLFLFAMGHTSHIAELASEPVSHRGRNEEIFWPLLTLASYIDTFGDESSLLSELGDALDEKTGLQDPPLEG